MANLKTTEGKKAAFLDVLVEDLHGNTHSWQRTYTPQKADTPQPLIRERITKVARRAANELKVAKDKIDEFISTVYPKAVTGKVKVVESNPAPKKKTAKKKKSK